MVRVLVVTLAVAVAPSVAAAQTPRPFPRPPASPTQPAEQPRPQPPPATAPQPQPPPDAPVVRAPAPAEDGVPTAATLGVPVYPGAHFITSYDAGQGQRFYLFGVASNFEDMVTYYRTTLDRRGEELFESPATYQFEVTRFRDDTMAFPPSVTIKDYAGGGSAGYPVVGPDGTVTRFPTIIQIVPAPPTTP